MARPFTPEPFTLAERAAITLTIHLHDVPDDALDALRLAIQQEQARRQGEMEAQP